MAYNKSKHIGAAQKYLNQGKLPQAIAEYQHILKNEPKDQVTLMTLGDLLVRQGETFQALEYFERLAKIFLNDGFTTKAIAIYKKVAKLAPEETRPLERLAELYVQQGVLSEARPLYLQLAEAQLRAGRQLEAAALLRKLLDAEPDNMRVRTRLAELQLVMGQSKDAVETFHGAVQRALDRGDHAEAIRLAERVLEIDAHDRTALLLKARALCAAGKGAEGLALLESLPEQDAGGDLTTLLFERYLESGQSDRAAALAEGAYRREPKNYPVIHRFVTAFLGAGDPDHAQALLGLIRNTMTDSGDHEQLALTITRLAKLRPGTMEPLEWLVDLYGKASDSFRLPDALGELARAQETFGDAARALETYERLLERKPDDEATQRECLRLRAKLGIETGMGPEPAYPPAVKLEPAQAEAGPPAVTARDPGLDEETQRYVTQALIDIDLFSSYGLTQKAIDLLETVVQHAPRHVPALERLLDLSVGAGNDLRTSEVAALLEQIAIERNDAAAAERYAEFRHRFQRAAGLSTTEPVAADGPAAVPEFAVPAVDAELVEPSPDAPEPLAPPQPSAASAPTEPPEGTAPAEPVVHEVDLSDEWAALSQQLEEATHDAAAAPPETTTPAAENAATTEPPKGKTEQAPAYDLEMQPAVPAGGESAAPLSADALLSDLANELETVTSSLETLQEPAALATPPATHPPAPEAASPIPASQGPPAPPAAPDTPAAVPAGFLGDLFEEFRSDLGESSQDDEDLETHYNLGVAYREMGLLEEAISEFQKVAKANDKGSAFRYAMQCCTLLGLAFMEKGQPDIAAMWYERALQTPGLDQESVLALRYDLGVAQELAGETAAAFKSFSQVYAMNIDYRDVAERVAILGKTR